jgi:hypothetical protein
MVVKKKLWLNSAARLILLDDLEEGILSLDPKDEPAKMAWEFYKDLPEFELVEYNQFRDRLRDHRKQVGDRKKQSAFEEEAFQHDRLLHPRSKHNSRGAPVFDLSDAKELLRADIKEGRHDGMKPQEFRETRQEYKSFSKKIFKERIYQEIRRNKYITYLEMKREKERTTTW